MFKLVAALVGSCDMLITVTTVTIAGHGVAQCVFVLYRPLMVLFSVVYTVPLLHGLVRCLSFFSHA